METTAAKARYQELLRAAESIRADVVNHTNPPLDRNALYRDGHPCCVGGWILWRAGWRPPDVDHSVYTGNKIPLAQYLGVAPPLWLTSCWYTMEEANDNMDLSDANRTRYILTALHALIKALSTHLGVAYDGY